jgi:hypothetical protein
MFLITKGAAALPKRINRKFRDKIETPVFVLGRIMIPLFFNQRCIASFHNSLSGIIRPLYPASASALAS